MIKGILILLVLLVVLSHEPALSNTPGLVQTRYASILSYWNTQIPEYLTENFDKAFERLARFFGVDIQKDERILVWVVPYNSLQSLYKKETPETRLNRIYLTPKYTLETVAAFYDAKLNRIYLTPRYTNEFYLTYMLVYYFMDEHPESTAFTLARFLVWQRLTEKSIVEEFILKK